MSRRKKRKFKRTHRENQELHASRRMLQRYPWVGITEYYRIRNGVVRIIRDGGASEMWEGSPRGGKGRLKAYAVTFEQRRYYVGYDHETGALTTWFPRTDPRVQAWVLEHYGADEVKALFDTNGQ
jgi:hypothetical protein